MKAKDIMTKGVYTIKANTLIKDIAKLLIDNKISGAPVLDDDGMVIGIVTRKDLIYKDIEPKLPSYIEFLGGVFYVDGVKSYEEKLKKFLANEANEIMTENVITISEEADVSQICEIMIEKRVNLLPVTKEGKLSGVVTRGNILETLIQ